MHVKRENSAYVGLFLRPVAQILVLMMDKCLVYSPFELEFQLAFATNICY
jgi:hypothetical protein